MTKTNIDLKLENPCSQKRTFCINCRSEFMQVRPFLKGVIVSKHFIRDLKNEEEMNSIIRDVLDCSNLEFTELHKFEENIDGNLVFRAKRGDIHIVYCVNRMMNVIFMRAIRNFTEYKKFLDDRKQVKKIIERLS